MREILFRGKAQTKYCLLKQNNGWVYGTPVRVKINTYLTKRIEIVEAHGYDELDYWELLSEDDEIDPETLSQFVGFDDMDGKKIFEGDIIRFNAGYALGRWTGVVEYDDANAQFVVSGVGDKFRSDDSGAFKVALSDINKSTIEIIGNRWDNPEFLEETT